MNKPTTDQIMANTKLVNMDEFTKEDWDIVVNGSRTGRIMMIHSLEESEATKHDDALVMLEGVMA